jgi:hypothetical protein
MIDPNPNPAKTGKRDEPELTLFDSPSVDRLAQMLLVMASELHVLRDRVRCLEFMLAQQGQIDLAALEHFQPSDEQAAVLARERDALVAHLFEVIDGRAKSTSGRFPASGLRETKS